ncbi:MAG: gliding motility lipoprotein GldD [Bacteroidia bacterium]
MSKRSFLPFLFFALVCSGFLFSSCDEDEEGTGTPKPRGYFRVEFPEKKYVSYNEDCPFSFEIPDYCTLLMSQKGQARPCWKDWQFPRFNATIHLSYIPIHHDTDLAYAINSSWDLIEKHGKVSSGMRDSIIMRKEDKVYGVVVKLGGNAASQMQFFMTDSSNHFIRGALYFFAPPNKDSLRPMLDFIAEDIYKMAGTLKWKYQEIAFTIPVVDTSEVERNEELDRVYPNIGEK